MRRTEPRWPRHNASDLIGKRILCIGDGYRAKNSEMGPVGLPFARAGNINGGFLFDGADLLDESNVPKAGEKVSQPADIVFTSKGTVGRFAFVRPQTPKFVYSPQLCFWRVLDSSFLDPRFLFFWMQSAEFLDQVQRVKGLTDMADYVSLSDQRRMCLTVPPPSIQRRIASILSAYDDLIENNTRRIKILEDMAQMLYREWFVNFRFPGHQKVKMVESELGKIPECCHVARLDDVVIFENGKAVPITQQGDFPLYGSNGLIGRTAASKYKNAVILGRVGAYCGSTVYCRNAFWASDNTIVAMPMSGDVFCVEATYRLLQTMDLRRYAGGAAQPLLTQTVLKQLKCVVPDQTTNQQFRELVQPIQSYILNLEARNGNLRTTRDLLLPKLISGQIPVEAAEAMEQTA